MIKIKELSVKNEVFGRNHPNEKGIKRSALGVGYVSAPGVEIQLMTV